LTLPQGITVDDAGRVYVAEVGNTRVQVFAGDGQFLYVWTPPAATSPSPDLGDVAVDAVGIVSVTDAARNLIYRFAAADAPAGSVRELRAEPDSLDVPWGAAVDAQGNLYVAEYANSRIQVFAPDGTSLGTVGSPGSEPGQFVAPIYVTIGPDGLLNVADESNRRVQVFRLLPSLGAEASAAGAYPGLSGVGDRDWV
jgi:sugar lactone lactonase YvrE